jgi:hypothetical protein
MVGEDGFRFKSESERHDSPGQTDGSTVTLTSSVRP